jgi:hypothetical protein
MSRAGIMKQPPPPLINRVMRIIITEVFKLESF